MFQRFLVALVKVKVSNTSENLLNKICYMTYFFYRANENTYNVYANIMGLI